MTAYTIKHKHKPTVTPTSTIIAAVDKKFLPPLENVDDNDADPANLMGKYDVRGKKKGKGGHRRKYRNDEKIEALHGLYEETKGDDENGRDDDDDDSNWHDMEEKEREEDYDKEDGMVDINAVQFFGMPDEEFLGKDTESKKNKGEDKKSMGDDNDGDKNSGGGAKSGKNMRGDIDRPVSKGINEDNPDSWDKHNFDVRGEEGAEWETTKGTRTKTKRSRRRRSRKKRGGGGKYAAADNAK